MDNPPIDPQIFENLYVSTGEDAAFIGELIETFCGDAENLFAQLETALAEVDCVTFRRAAHTLKSGSNSLGALSLGRLCLELEEMGKIGNLDGAGPLLGEANMEYGRACAELARKRQHLGARP